MGGNNSAITDLVDKVSDVILNPLIALIFAASFLIFLWGLVMYLYELNTGGHWYGNGRKHLFWGIAGMFIMVAAWAIVKLIDATLGSNVLVY